jgi:hypothetical protein
MDVSAQSQPSLSLVQSTSGSTSISHASTSTLNSQGLHDTLTYGPRSIADEVAPRHPLEQRLGQVRWAMALPFKLASVG